MICDGVLGFRIGDLDLIFSDDGRFECSFVDYLLLLLLLFYCNLVALEFNLFWIDPLTWRFLLIYLCHAEGGVHIS
jgi:hypothetical protein